MRSPCSQRNAAADARCKRDAGHRSGSVPIFGQREHQASTPDGPAQSTATAHRGGTEPTISRACGIAQDSWHQTADFMFSGRIRCTGVPSESHCTCGFRGTAWQARSSANRALSSFEARQFDGRAGSASAPTGRDAHASAVVPGGPLTQAGRSDSRDRGSGMNAPEARPATDSEIYCAPPSSTTFTSLESEVNVRTPKAPLL